jgi:hypothetical protein
MKNLSRLAHHKPITDHSHQQKPACDRERDKEVMRPFQRKTSDPGPDKTCEIANAVL